MCFWPDCCQGFFCVSAAALLLVSSMTLHRFNPRSVFSACNIAASSPEYGFCSALAPSVTERVFSLGFRYRGGCFSIASPNPTISLRAELLTAIRMTPPASVRDDDLCVCGEREKGSPRVVRFFTIERIEEGAAIQGW